MVKRWPPVIPALVVAVAAGAATTGCRQPRVAPYHNHGQNTGYPFPTAGIAPAALPLAIAPEPQPQPQSQSQPPRSPGVALVSTDAPNPVRTPALPRVEPNPAPNHDADLWDRLPPGSLLPLSTTVTIPDNDNDNDNPDTPAPNTPPEPNARTLAANAKPDPAPAATFFPSIWDGPRFEPIPIPRDGFFPPLLAASWRENWRDGLHALDAVAARFPDAPSPSPSDSAADPNPFPRREFHERLVRWMTLDLDQPPDAPRRDPLRELDEIAPFEIRELLFCARVRGFGQYDPVPLPPPTPTESQSQSESQSQPQSPPLPAFEPGARVILYCELGGLKTRPRDGQFLSILESRIEILRDSDSQVVWSHTVGKAEDLCRKPRLDCYANYLLVIPRALEPGQYRVRLVQTDRVGAATAAREIPFRLNPPRSEPRVAAARTRAAE